MTARAGAAATQDEGAFNRRLVVLIWSFLTAVWSIFTPPHRTFAARLLLFQPSWPIRAWFGDSNWTQDLALSLILHASHGYLIGSWRVWRLSDFSSIDLNNCDLWIYLQIFSLLGVCGAFAGGIVRRGHQLKIPEHNGYPKRETIEEELLPPLLITSRTTHTRIFPRKHSFSYSYLFVGVPVGVQGKLSRALSIDSQQRGWFEVRSVDHLDRGSTHLSLGEKLKRYLHTQGVTDRDYSFAYLVTAPRFLGYTFNPVSFWYLYDSDTALKYMILEVNNTFDERRMYLLHVTKETIEEDANGPTASGAGAKSNLRRMVFSEPFEKDFHVSPFNSRKGSYSLRAVDPLAVYESTGETKVDNTIVLRSSKESAKIVARVWSEGAPKDATHIKPLELLRFIASWWWVGFFTFPRIVWEAQKLYFRRELHVWYRPEVTTTSLGRSSTADEVILAAYFKDFLEDAIASSDSPLRLIYEPAHREGEEIVMYSPKFTYEEDQKCTLTIQIVSPAFYSRFIHYGNAKEAFERECLATDEKNRSLRIAPPEALPIFLDAISKAGRPDPARKQSLRERLHWTILQRLRYPPPDVSYPTDAERKPTNNRYSGDSELDTFVKRRNMDGATYRRLVIKLFLASRFAFGVPVLVSALDVLLRCSIILAMLQYCRHAKPVDMLRPRALDTEDYWTAGITLLLANGVHIWSFIKSSP